MNESLLDNNSSGIHDFVFIFFKNRLSLSADSMYVSNNQAPIFFTLHKVMNLLGHYFKRQLLLLKNGAVTSKVISSVKYMENVPLCVSHTKVIFRPTKAIVEFLIFL